MQENRIRIDFGWKSFLHFLAQGRRRDPAQTCEKFWKKYILKIHKFYVHLQKQALKIQTEQNRTASNQFWLKNFRFIFWHQAAGADLWKNLKKIYFENPQTFMFNCNSRPWKFKWTAFESILAEKVSFHFWKSLKKIYFENPTILCSIATAGHENSNEQHSNQFWLKKFRFNFWPQVAGADLWKNLKKIYFENPPILCSIATAGPENAREQYSNGFWLKKFPFIFRLKAEPVKSSEKNIFWKSTNFMFNSNSRPWKYKRTELESILVENSFLSFFGIKVAGVDLRKVLKKIYFENPPILCSFFHFWLKKFLSFFGLSPQAQTCEKIWKKNILNIHQFYFQ